MEAPSLPVRQRTAPPFLRRLDVALIGSGVALLVLAATVLLVRRLSGGLSVPLPSSLLVVSGWLIATLAAAMRLAAYRRPVADRRVRLTLCIVPTAAVLTSSAAISLPGSSAAGVAALWCIVAAIEVSSYVAAGRHWRGANFTIVERPRRRRQKEPKVRFDVPHATAEPHHLAPGLAQRIERGVSDEAEEFCHGLLRARFEAAQRTEAVHVSFCPPFLTIPEFHVEQIDGPDAKIKVAQVLPYGARVEIRLNRAPTARVETVLEFSAIARAS